MLTLKASEIQTPALIAFHLIHEQTSRLSNEAVGQLKTGTCHSKTVTEIKGWLTLANKISHILEADDKEIKVPLATVHLINRILDGKITLEDLNAGILSVGQIVDVGEFFWIPEENIIGLDDNWQHGHRRKDGGSVDTNCSVEIRSIEDDTAIVRLNRPEVPYGAPAAIGIVFSLPIGQIESWSKKLTVIRTQREWRGAKARAYCE